MSLRSPRPADLARYRPILETTLATAARRGQEVWLCGGTLRDLFLGLPPPDVDLAVNGDAMALGRAIAEAGGARFVALKEANATCRLVREGWWLDLAGLRAPSLEQDLRARDFTVNALAWELGAFLAGEGSLIDPTGGLNDLQNRSLRAAGPGVLREDTLRVLRAFRFVATHGLNLTHDMPDRLRAAAPGLRGVAPERVGHEWLLMAGGERAAQAMMGLEETGALGILLPALEAGRGVQQNPYHHLDVLGHSLAAARALGAISAEPTAYWQAPQGAEISACLALPSRRALVMTAALLHDLGKPVTREERGPGEATFYRHDLAGSDLARAACRDLGLSKNEAGLVALLVREHMRPFFLLADFRRGRLSNRAVRRLLVAAGEHLPGLMALALADTMAGRGPQRPPEVEDQLRLLYAQVAELRDRELAAALAAPPLISGHDVMNSLGLESGPLVGEVLRRVREAQLEGQIKTREEALALARNVIGYEQSGD